jgi:hypothetical protein
MTLEYLRTYSIILGEKGGPFGGHQCWLPEETAQFTQWFHQLPMLIKQVSLQMFRK